MRSIFSKVLLWFVGTVAISLAGLWVTSMVVSARLPEHFDFMAKTQQLQLDGAIQAYEEGGPDKLKNYLGRIDQLYFAQHLLVDSKGTNLVDGSDHSDLLRAGLAGTVPPAPPERPDRVQPGLGRRTLPAPDPRPAAGRAVVLLPVFPLDRPGRRGPRLLAGDAHGPPLEGLRQAVERFGHGDLTVRFGSDRRDEIGQLAAAFNQMAGRIETLLTAERRLLQDVSHELRSPLTRLGFALELARTAPDREAALARARKESGRLADLVDELLQLTRAEGDPSARIREDVALGDLLAELAADGSVEAEAKALRDHRPGRSARRRPGRPRAPPPGRRERGPQRHPPRARAHPDRDRSQPPRRAARIEVRDHGPGVPDALLEEVFRPFFRVEDDRNRASGGVGLGLAIARRAVALHQGTIHARNASPGLAIAIEIPGARTGPAYPEARERCRLARFSRSGEPNPCRLWDNRRVSC